ncbi:LytTR family transcriptional regulator DNA-binding domain-containing protein [Aquiflexum sp.]|uniref:LytTR family transcriptional regulator DNA-binding domain-containing protein n=1 Tax=Aquiflexum sp. TaxID=1872584 RepID=UPI0035946DFD
MESNFYFLKCNHKVVKLDMHLVTHISVDDYVVTIHCLDGSIHSCCSSLKRMENELPSVFKKINRSCLANSGLIQSIHSKEREITMLNDIRLRVAKSKWSELKREFVQLKHRTNQIHRGK